MGRDHIRGGVKSHFTPAIDFLHKNGYIKIFHLSV